MSMLKALEATCACLMSDIGESSMRSLGARFLAEYRALPEHQRADFFSHLVAAYGVDAVHVDDTYATWRRSRGHDRGTAARAEVSLIDAVEPARQRLFRRVNHAPGATLELARLRSDLRRMLPRRPDLTPLDHDLHHLLGSWFNRGFLHMEEVTWNSSGELLDHLVTYEQVHPMAGLEELRRRLQPPDRKIYAFFHPATRDIPLIFVEVALTKGVPNSMAQILGPGPSLPVEEADTAVLYSISNSLDGLTGVSFGSLLIKQVIDEVTEVLPHLETFATLSPLPGFRPWLAAQRDGELSALRELLELELPDHDSEASGVMLATLARYIAVEKDSRGRPLDPVARFHLSNGALAWRVHRFADPSPKAAAQSYGAMISYLYDPANVERRHEEHLRNNTIALSGELASLLNKTYP